MERNRSGESVRDLVQLAQEGDRNAFERLVVAHYSQIRRWALGIAGDSDDADDVVQEVLVRLHRRLKSYEAKSHFSTWLFQVTRNVALEQQRKRARRKKLMLGFLRAEPSDGALKEDQLDRVESSQMVSRIRTLFERLPARQRQVFDLADLQGHTPAEIGDMLGMNAVTVRANLCKARRAIRKSILERFPEMAEEVRT